MEITKGPKEHLENRPHIEIFSLHVRFGRIRSTNSFF